MTNPTRVATSVRAASILYAAPGLGFGIIGLLAAVILINGLPAWTLLALFFVLAAIGRFSQRQA